MGFRKYFCWLLGHRYKVIWFKEERYGQAGIADTEAGCIYCGYTEPNSYPLWSDIVDWEATKHRNELPKHNVIGKQRSEGER